MIVTDEMLAAAMRVFWSAWSGGSALGVAMRSAIQAALDEMPSGEPYA